MSKKAIKKNVKTVPANADIEFTFDFAHRLSQPVGPENNIHGHHGRVVFNVTSPFDLEYGAFLPRVDLRSKLAVISDVFEHALMLHKDDPLVDMLRTLPIKIVLMDGAPTAENIALYMLQSAQALLVPADVVVEYVEVSIGGYTVSVVSDDVTAGIEMNAYTLDNTKAPSAAGKEDAPVGKEDEETTEETAAKWKARTDKAVADIEAGNAAKKAKAKGKAVAEEEPDDEEDETEISEDSVQPDDDDERAGVCHIALVVDLSKSAQNVRAEVIRGANSIIGVIKKSAVSKHLRVRASVLPYASKTRNVQKACAAKNLEFLPKTARTGGSSHSFDALTEAINDVSKRIQERAKRRDQTAVWNDNGLVFLVLLHKTTQVSAMAMYHIRDAVTTCSLAGIQIVALAGSEKAVEQLTEIGLLVDNIMHVDASDKADIEDACFIASSCVEEFLIACAEGPESEALKAIKSDGFFASAYEDFDDENTNVAEEKEDAGVNDTEETDVPEDGKEESDVPEDGKEESETDDGEEMEDEEDDDEEDFDDDDDDEGDDVDD